LGRREGWKHSSARNEDFRQNIRQGTASLGGGGSRKASAYPQKALSREREGRGIYDLQSAWLREISWQVGILFLLPLFPQTKGEDG